MFVSRLTTALVLAAGLADVAVARAFDDAGHGMTLVRRQDSGAAADAAAAKNGGNGNATFTLNPKAVQVISNEVASEAGISKSLLSPNNFINFCVEQSSFKGILNNGKQVATGACTCTRPATLLHAMTDHARSLFGDVPAFQKESVVSSLILSPTAGQVIAENTAFDVVIAMNGLVTGSFTDPKNTYYAAPQTLQNGQVVGHSHITCQDLGDGKTAPDGTLFGFFKGLNAAAVNGLLTVSVTKGLPAGSWRCCTMSAASNHQPVLMSVAQRGAQDDCQKFIVKKGANVNGTTTAATASASATATAKASVTTSAKASTTASAKASTTASAKASTTASAKASTTASAKASASTTAKVGTGKPIQQKQKKNKNGGKGKKGGKKGKPGQ
ncbi:MAG: hypothetical protein M1826_006456 [Phylliscum demangeonii]|nr:MAG: hypothetical protein M1826_006456 [Phylliscum demangeonii]